MIKHNLIWRHIAVLQIPMKRANGLRYPRVGGRGQGLRAEKNSEPEKSW